MSATVPDPVIVAQRLIAVLVALVLTAATMVFGASSTQAVAADNARKPSGPSDSIVSITDTMSPAHLMVAPGETVTWVNNDTETHRVVSDRGASVEFDSGVLEPGERWSRSFASATDVTYHDHGDAANPAYFGMVMVERDASAGSGTSAGGTGSGVFATNTGSSNTDSSNTASFASSSAAPNAAAAAVGPKQVFVEIHNKNEFRPGNVSVAKGGTVTWFNDHSDDHTATGAGGINSGRLHRDQRYSKTFNTPGIYDYVCVYHDRMKAKITVLKADGSKPPPPPPGDGGGAPPPPGANNKTVSITSNFSPGSVTVPVGGSVSWTNNDSAPHTATGSGGINSGNLNNGQSYTKKFTAAGTFTYVCAYHSDMTGTVKVMNGSGEVPPPPPGGGGGGGGNPPPPPGDGGGSPPPPPPGGGGGGGGSQAPAKASVTIDDDFFSPKAVTIRAGGSVTWTNRGNPHTATGSAFDSGNLNTGQKFTHRFPKAGTYAYVCAYHSDMTGTIKVTNASGGVPPGSPGGPPGGGGGAGGGGAGGGGAGGGGAGGGGAGGGGGGGSSPSAQTHTVTMGASSFSPGSFSARVGDKVIFKNSSPVPHNVVPLTSSPIMGGQTYTTVLREQGTLSYKCTFHSGMSGTIKVGAAPAGTTLPPPSAGGGLSGGSSSSMGSMGSTGSSSGSSSGGSAGAPAPGAESHTISMVNSTFDPQVLQARVGDEVTWVNDDPIPHNVTGGALDSGMMMGGAEYTTVLTEAGTVEYECTLHPGMTGTLEVAEALPGTKVPPASSSTTSGGSSSAAGSAAPSTESAPSADPEEGAKNHTVEMDNMVFSPDTLEANVGDTVTFVNKEAAPHTATAEDKSWDSGNMNEGQEWTLKLDKVGTIKYVCIYHPGMDGTLIVKPKGEEVAPASASSDDAAASEGTMPASQIAGLSSGWLVLLVLLAGLQLQSRFSSRRKPEQVAPRPPGGYSA